MKRRRFTVLFWVVMACLAVAACGSSGGSSSGSGSAASTARARFIERADAICKQGNQAGAALAKQLSNAAAGGKYAKLSVVIGEAVMSGQATLNKLRALPAPSGDTATVHEMWTYVQEMVTGLHDLGVAFATRNSVKVTAAEAKVTAAQTKYQKLAQSYGFKYCGLPH